MFKGFAKYAERHLAALEFIGDALLMKSKAGMIDRAQAFEDRAMQASPETVLEVLEVTEHRLRAVNEHNERLQAQLRDHNLTPVP